MLRNVVWSLGLSALITATASVAWSQPAAVNGPAGETVTWAISPPELDGLKRGARAVLIVHGAVRPGWHVYGLNQAPSGPTPLKVAVETNDVAKGEGQVKGSAPLKRRDPAFGADTEFYADAFTVSAAVRIGAHAATGRQQIPLSVRFQTCNGEICQPPKTVRLSAPVTVRGDG